MKTRLPLLVALLIFFSLQGRSQMDAPDPLGSAFRIAAQARLRAKLPAKSCAVVFSGGFQAYDPSRQFPRDFSSDPDFYYLTGYRYPDAVAVVFSEPRALVEGNVSTLVFLPDKADYGLASMGCIYRGKFGMVGEGLATRPIAQWKKFCTEVLAAESMERIFSKPLRETDFKKPGDRDYNYLGAKFFATLAPGYAFSPQVQRFYKDILATDTTGMASLATRISAMLEYEMPEEKDPILVRFIKSRDSESLRQLQKEIERMKVDLLQMAGWMAEQRILKTEQELTLMRKAAAAVTVAMQAVAARVRTGISEASLQATADYVLRLHRGLLVKPSTIASGAASALPNYAAPPSPLPKSGPVVVDLAVSMEGYHARATRTLPVNGDFGADLRPLYEGVVAIHKNNLQACQPRASVRKLAEAASTAFEELNKRLVFNTNALGARKVLKITHVATMGLELEEGGATLLPPDAVLCVETALYLPDEDGVTSKWRGIGVVLRDMLRITASGNEVLTQALPLDASAVEAMVKATFKLPED